MKITKKNISQMVVEEILGQVEHGELKSGDKLQPERDLAEKLGVSRVPLREAICALSSMGIIESRQGGGNYITSYQPDVFSNLIRTYSILDQSFFEDLFEARVETEAIAARLAARNATLEDIEHIRYAVDAFDQEVRDLGNKPFVYERMTQLDEYVHLGIGNASHNSFYVHFVKLLHRAGAEEKDIRFTYEKYQQYYMQATSYHKRLLEAIEYHKEDQAYELMTAHIKDIQNTVERIRNENRRESE